MKDALGRELQKGDIVIFGKSNRHHPINFGVVMEIKEEELSISGYGNDKLSNLSEWATNQRVFLINEMTQDIMFRAILSKEKEKSNEIID